MKPTPNAETVNNHKMQTTIAVLLWEKRMLKLILSKYVFHLGSSLRPERSLITIVQGTISSETGLYHFWLDDMHFCFQFPKLSPNLLLSLEDIALPTSIASLERKMGTQVIA